MCSMVHFAVRLGRSDSGFISLSVSLAFRELFCLQTFVNRHIKGAIAMPVVNASFGCNNAQNLDAEHELTISLRFLHF